MNDDKDCNFLGTAQWLDKLNAGHMAARDQPKLIELFKRMIGF